MNRMNYVIMSNMSTCMNALCRHVTKINHRGEGGWPRTWNIYMGLSENSVPLHPMVNDHYPY